MIVAFNSEAEEITDSLMIPGRGTKTLAINPLNWKTDGTAADKSLNLGACFTNYSGEIEEEIPALTGAYIDDVRVRAEGDGCDAGGISGGAFHFLRMEFIICTITSSFTGICRRMSINELRPFLGQSGN